MRPVTLGPGQFAVLLAGVATALVVCWVILMPSLQDSYLREIAIPKLEERYGFVGGPVAFTTADGAYQAWGVVQLKPGSRLAALGMRQRDVPTAYHSGLTQMYHALRAAEQRQFASFEVINADDWSIGRTVTRTVVAYPQQTDLPAHFRWADGEEVISPSGRFSLAGQKVSGPPDSYELRLRNASNGESRKVYSYEMHVAAVWSPDEEWIALTDYDDDSPQCILIDTIGGALNIREKALLPAIVREPDGIQQLSCEIFGWLRGTSRIAVRLRPSEWRAPRCYFLDTSTWTLTDASVGVRKP